jgi:hypothetical protein
MSTYIIIEPKKFHFTVTQIREYLRDLKSMGFDFTFVKKRSTGEFWICMDKMKSLRVRTTFGMAVRYLWEGTVCCMPEYDQYIEVIKHYFKLKEMLPTENKAVVLCIACNCYLMGSPNYNMNHFFSGPSGCKLVKDMIATGSSSTNSYFGRSHPMSKTSKLKKADAWKQKNYDLLFKVLKYDYSSKH